MNNNSDIAEIILVRHGRIKKGMEKTFIGWTDAPLSGEGVDQARALGAAFSSTDFSGITSSDLARCAKTAECISRHHPGVSVIMDPDFREINLGEWEGLSFSEVKGGYPDEFKLRGEDIVGYRPPGAESFLDLSKRVVPAFERLAKRANGRILIATHIGVIRVILAHLLGFPLENIFKITHDYGAYSELERKGTGFRLVRHNITP